MLGAYSGGWTVNLTTGAWPGVTVPMTGEPSGRTSQPCGAYSENRTPCSVWLPEAVSCTLTVTGLPGRDPATAR